jgi:hypothetical protein
VDNNVFEIERLTHAPQFFKQEHTNNSNNPEEAENFENFACTCVHYKEIEDAMQGNSETYTKKNTKKLHCL